TTREETRESLKKRYRFLLSKHDSPEEKLEELVNENYVEPQWYEDLHPQGSVLDFPLKASSAWGSINDFQNEIREGDFMGSKNLSYADSLFSGYLFDSFNRLQSACSF